MTFRHISRKNLACYPSLNCSTIKFMNYYLLISFPAIFLFTLVSFGCRHKYITALPMPLILSARPSIGGNWKNNVTRMRYQWHSPSLSEPKWLVLAKTYLGQNFKQTFTNLKMWQRAIWQRAEPVLKGITTLSITYKWLSACLDTLICEVFLLF